MHFVETYLTKHNFSASIGEPPANGLNSCVVIPAFNEPDLILTLESLWKCIRPSSPVEIIVVINSPENAGEEVIRQNELSMNEAESWIEKHNDPTLKFYLVHRPNLPEKFAGVGLARKIGMDEAVNRLMLARNHKGIIACFDADATCDANYLTELEIHFNLHPKSNGASIYFEHPLDAYGTLTNNGITQYELHLRYMNQALRYTGHPFAFHTVGSSMAVRMDGYVKQGGMNKRKAGEDFYFLQKIIELGFFSEINTTRVIPSPRISNRVPFGTGASMKRWHTENKLETYNLGAYDDIRNFLALIDSFYNSYQPDQLDKLSQPLKEYLQRINFDKELTSIRSNSASLPTFCDRFYRWFNVFRVIKYLNYANENFYTKGPVYEESNKLLLKMGFDQKRTSTVEMLYFYRNLDKTGFGLKNG